MRQRKKADLKIKDLYSYYLEKVPTDLQVPYSVYRDVLKEFNALLVEEIIHNSEGIKLPLNLGYLRVRKSKVNLTRLDKLIPDWGATNKLWEENPKAKEDKKLIFHLNEHRGGFKYKIFWDKSQNRLPNKSFYYFIPTRAFKRNLASVLKNNHTIDYYL